MNREDIRNQISTFLTDELEIEPSLLRPESRLREDMGIDSLEVVDLVVLLDETFGVRLRSEDFRRLDTLGKLCAYIEEKTS